MILVKAQKGTLHSGVGFGTTCSDILQFRRETELHSEYSLGLVGLYSQGAGCGRSMEGYKH